MAPLRRPILLAALLLAAPAGAQPKREARLEYLRGLAAEHCPEEEAIRTAVSERLGYEPFNADAPTTVSVKITRVGSVLRADVELREASGNVAGTRQLTSNENDCSELVAAMTLAISMAIDPQSQTQPAPPVEPPAEPAPPRVVLPSPRSSRLLPPKRASDPVVGRAGVGALLAVGSEPGVNVGFAARLGAGWRSISADVEGRIDLPASKKARGGGSVNASLLSVSLVPCWHRGALVACALGSIGALRGYGSDVRIVRTDTTLFWAAGARVGVEVGLGGTFSGIVYGDLTAIGPTTELELNGVSQWRTAPIAAAVGLALQAHFP